MAKRDKAYQEWFSKQVAQTPAREEALKKAFMDGWDACEGPQDLPVDPPKAKSELGGFPGGKIDPTTGEPLAL